MFLVVQESSGQPVVSQRFAGDELVVYLNDFARYLDSRVYMQYAARTRLIDDLSHYRKEFRFSLPGRTEYTKSLTITNFSKRYVPGGVQRKRCVFSVDGHT